MYINKVKHLNYYFCIGKTKSGSFSRIRFLNLLILYELFRIYTKCDFKNYRY